MNDRTLNLTILTPCYNEVDNVDKLSNAVIKISKKISGVKIKHLFIDNASTDGTIDKLRSLCSKHKHIQVILNNRNYGHLRSPMHGLYEARGDAVVVMAADFEDPPELIIDFVKKWREGFKAVVGVKEGSNESIVFSLIRNFYYFLVNRLSSAPLIKNFSGFGLFDREIIETVKSIEDPYPYFRGLISELGFEIAQIKYKKIERHRGFSKNNFYSLYDIALLGITNHSKIPLRLATFSGFIISFLSILVGMGYFIYKLLYWDSFVLGLAPLVIGIFFFAAIQLFFIGIIGEYIGSIHTKILNRPLVIEKERINF